jgi:hypothetical protein
MARTPAQAGVAPAEHFTARRWLLIFHLSTGSEASHCNASQSSPSGKNPRKSGTVAAIAASTLLPTSLC